MAPPATDITASVDATLDDQARRTELEIARLRVTLLLVGTAIDWVRFFLDNRSVTVPLLSSLWALGGIAVARHLSRKPLGYAARLTLVSSDPLLLTLLMWNVLRIEGGERFVGLGRMGAVIAAAALIAASGGLRLGIKAARYTLILAVALFSIFSWLLRDQIALGGAAYPMIFIVGAGLLGRRMGDLTRAALQSEVARLTILRFLPGRVVDGAFDDPEQLFGPPRTLEATVLVSDLRGFTALSEGMAPHDVLAFLNDLQGRFAACVGRHGGTVDKFMGDGMLAVFGAPENLPDHAAQALACAIAMRAEVAALNVDRRAKGEGEVRIGVGIHSGPVVVGCLGQGARLEFTVIGDTVNTASRLEALTKEKACDLLVSEEVARRVADRSRLVPIGEATLRGKQVPLQLLRVD